LQPVRTGIEVVVLQLLGGRMAAGRVVELIETRDVFDVNGG
jgi:hypothetical protein